MRRTVAFASLLFVAAAALQETNLASAQSATAIDLDTNADGIEYEDYNAVTNEDDPNIATLSSSKAKKKQAARRRKQQAKKNKNKKATESPKPEDVLPDVVYSHTYDFDGKQFNCLHSAYVGYKFECPPMPPGADVADPPGNKLEKEPSITVPKKEKDWKAYCGMMCAEHALTFRGYPCRGFLYNPVTRKCTLKRCDLPDAESLKVKPQLDYISIRSSCFDPPTQSPTRFPTTRSPTAKPTKRSKSPTKKGGDGPAKPPTLPNPPPEEEEEITDAPTFRPTTEEPTMKPTYPTMYPTYPTRFPTPPTVFRTDSPTPSPESGDFVSPSRIPRSYPVQYELYGNKPISVNTQLCEIVQVRLGSHNIVYDNWRGDRDDCVRECTYDSMCMFVLYSPVAKTCVKTVQAQITDDETAIDTWVDQKWVAYVKSTRNGVVPYLAGFCATFKGVNGCSKPTCKWNAGKKGENQMSEFTNGWCGRIKCARGRKSLV